MFTPLGRIDQAQTPWDTLEFAANPLGHGTWNPLGQARELLSPLEQPEKAL